MGAIAPRVRLNRNDLCHCGSGLKYKRCHLEKDRAQEHAAYQETLEHYGPGHTHPSHPLCRLYHPISTGMPADARPEFNSLLRMMHAQGYTLLHVFEPRHLARRLEDYQKVLELVRRYGIILDFAEDPNEVELKLAQRCFDCVFGEGVYRVLPVGSDFDDYPDPGRRIVDGVIEVTIAQSMTAPRLMEEKLVDWDAQGIPPHPLALRVAAAAGDVLSDLLRDCLTRMGAVDGPLGWETAEALLVNIFEAARSLGKLGKSSSPNRAIAAIAVGLALPQLLETTSNACIESLELSEPASASLISVAGALRSDENLRTVALAGADGNWRTPVGFAAWVDEIDSQVLSDIGIEKPAVAESHSLAVVAPSNGDRSAVESVTNLATIVPAVEPEVDLFTALDVIAQSAQQPVDRLREEVSARHLNVERLVRELEIARQAVVDKERQLQEERTEIDRQEDQVDSLLLSARKGRAQALLDVLVEASTRVVQLRDRWSKDGVPEELQETPDVAKARELIVAYEGSQRRGAMEQLDPLLRQLMQGQVEAARKVLEAAGLTDLAPAKAELTLPVAIALGARTGRVRLTALLPFDALAPDALGPADPTTAVAAMVTAQMAQLLGEFGFREEDPKVQARALGRGVTLLSMEAAGVIADDDVADDQALCEQWLQDAAVESPALRRARLKIQFHGIEPGLLALLGEASDER
jgi:hypothetical protein